MKRRSAKVQSAK